MKKLVEKEWNNYNVSEIFSKIQRGKRLKKADHVPGAVPYVSSTANNNGVDSFIEAVHGTRIFNDCISLANSGSVGTAFYEPFKFVASDHVTSLRREDTSKESYLFLSAMVEKQGVNFNFNREINDSRIKKMQLMLPVDDLGNPDYGYMTQYASEMRRGMLMRYRIYVASQLSRLEYEDIPELNEKAWNEYSLEKIFYVESGKRLTNAYKVGHLLVRRIIITVLQAL